MQFSVRTRRKIFINLTSLLDVIFNLLIFLLVSTTFIEQPGIKLELPSSKTSETQKSNDFVLVVTKDNKLLLDDEEIKEDNLLSRLKGYITKEPDKPLILRADKEVTHGKVVKIMDIAKQSGVKKLVVATVTEK
jgi:biopolymer transport protein ExbD